MKQIEDLVRIIEHHENCVVLEFIGSELDYITFGCFDGTERYYRVERKGGDEYMTLWYKGDKEPFTWMWGDSGYTCVSDELWNKKRILNDYINRTLGTNF